MTQSRSYFGFAFLWLFSAAILWHFLFQTLAQAVRNDEFTHILLILPISTALILSQWAPPGHPWEFRNLWAASWLFAVGCLLAVSTTLSNAWHTPDVRLAIGMLALVVFWIAAFVLCFGTRAARSQLFPLCFLFWLVPIPSFALVRIVQVLQRGSALAAWLLFSAARVPASLQGIFLSIPGLDIEVARECSSIRSSLMLLVTTMVLAHVLLRTPWRKTILVLLAVPLSVFKNGLRVFTITMLGTRVDRRFLSGWLHRQGGGVFFLIALSMILAFLWLLRRSEARAARLALGSREVLIPS